MTDLREAFYKTLGGSEILRCIQCGTCSASCPLGEKMDLAPRELFALIRDGRMDEVLRSNTPWFCVSCYRCMVRCPQQIPITDLMYRLKEMAVQNHLTPSRHKQPDLSQAFVGMVQRNGRITESLVMAGYGARHPGDMGKSLPLAIKLLIRGRLDYFPNKIVGRDLLRGLLSEQEGDR